MKVEPQELSLLHEVGLLAVYQGDLAAAVNIFAAIEAERPESPAAYAGLFFAHLRVGEVSDAIRCVERALPIVDSAHRPELYAFLGFACWMDGRSAQCDRALQAAGDIPLARAVRQTFGSNETMRRATT